MSSKRYTKVLLVEGKDDKHVVWALCERLRIPQTFEVVDCDGIDSLKEQLSVIFTLSQVDTVGVMVDADTNVQARWKALRDILTSLGFIIPDALPKEGLIAANDGQKAGVWIMPNNNTNGMLEDFIAFLVPKDDALLPFAHATLDEIETRQLHRYANVHKVKAAIHTWLAWQSEPGTPMGQSITKRYLTTDEATCKTFTDWLTKLFI